MIRFIAAIDRQRGIADDHGIPWQGKLPTDVKYYRDQIKSGTMLMGYGLYKELAKPFPGDTNFVATSQDVKLKPGFERVKDAREFIKQADSDIWNLGGAGLYESTLDLADELYLTLIDGDFGCTKFFPAFEATFQIMSATEAMTENDITFWFTIWKRK